MSASRLLDGVLAPGTVRRHVLSNGLTVLVAPDDRVPVTAIVTWVRAGYFDESDDIVGIAHVLEHMYFKGTPHRGVGAIARETKAHGGYLNAGTIYDHTSYYAVLPASGFAGGLEVQADAYANSLIDAGELAREIEVIVEEAKRKADSPHAVATETMFELLHDVHRMRRWRIGREPGLRALTRELVHAFYRRFYQPSNTVLAIAGDVRPDEALRHVERLYGALPDAPVTRERGPIEPARRDFRVREWTGDIAQAELVVGWRTPRIDHPDAPVLDVAASALSAGRSSRLYRAVRERQLASSISAFHYVPEELGVFGLHATGRPERMREAAVAAWHQVGLLRDGDVTDAELDRLRRVHDASWLRRLETVEGRANFLASWEALGGWHKGSEYFDAMQSVTRASLAEVTRRHLAPDACAVVAYRPAGAASICGDAAEFRAALDTAPGFTLPPTEVVPEVAIVRAAPAFERRVGEVHVYRTAAGVPLLVQQTTGATVAYAGVFVRAGAVHEPADRLGVASLAARVSLKGTVTRDANRIAEESERLGASLSASANSETTQWTVSVPMPRLAGALALLGDVVQAPTFPGTALEGERAVMRSQLAQLRDDMYRYPLHLATQEAWGSHPYARLSLGDEATLPGLTSDALAEWHRRYLLTGDQVVVVVGDADPAELAALAGGVFGALAPAPAPTITAPAWPSVPAVRHEQRDKAQTALVLAFPGPSRDDPSRFAAGLLGGIASGLGGRLFEALRDKQSLAYTVLASPHVRPLAGQFVAYIATSPEKEGQARAGLLSELAKFADAPVSAEELERARTYALGTHAISLERGSNVMGDIADAWLFGALEELGAWEGRMRAVTAADIQAVARRAFDPARVVEGVVRGKIGR